MRGKKIIKMPKKNSRCFWFVIQEYHAWEGGKPSCGSAQTHAGAHNPPRGCANSSPLLGVIRSQMDHLTLQQESWTVPLPLVPAWGAGGCGWLGALQPRTHELAIGTCSPHLLFLFYLGVAAQK